jgi:hypothetical protein
VASSAVPARVLEEAVDRTAAAGGPVAVVIPAVLPATLPVWAAPARLLARVSRQRQAARDRLSALGVAGSVEVVPCRSAHAAISALCAEHPPSEIVIAGPASWRLRRALRAIARG